MNLSFILLLFFMLYLLLIWKGGKTVPIMYMFLFVYFLQYVFSVFLIYTEYPLLRKEMPIGEEQLFDYIIPALLFLFGGVFIFNKDVNISEILKNIDSKRAARLGHLLVFTSFFFDLISFLGFHNIDSVRSFTYYLRFSGAMCYLFSPSILTYTLMSLIYTSLLTTALGGGVFIDFIMWSFHLFLLACLYFQISFALRSLFIVVAAPVLILIQSVKSEYRALTWTGKRESGIGFFAELVGKRQEKESDPFENSEGIMSTVGRLNQGWHLAKVLKRVPSKEPFSDGVDMLSDLQGVVLPRIFYPDKKTIGSQEKFKKFTGHRLRGKTSMTIGVLGDFYVNFGRWGSFIGLFIFGALMARIFHGFMVKFVATDPINVVWIPFLFSFMVRANNDTYIVVNNLFKGFLLFLFVNYAYSKIWPTQSVASKK